MDDYRVIFGWQPHILVVTAISLRQFIQPALRGHSNGQHWRSIDDEVTIVYERDRPVAVTMPYAAYERLRGVDPFADRPLSRDPVDLAIARAGDKANAAEAAARQRVAAREDRSVTETVPAEVARALASGVPPLKAWREGRALTQAVLVERACLSRAYLAQLEAGALIPPAGQRG